MSDPVLQREAEVPRTRSTGGAIVVAVAFFSLFTALGASAFVIRVRAMATQGYLHSQTIVTAPPILATQVLIDGPVPVELLSRSEAAARAERALGDDERE